ncbi:MAG: hypothetical protein LBS91_00480 [Clostridiales Family XIII bacterium]|nr:hypothetical protein [Clostridiales Family XIII bacterium]
MKNNNLLPFERNRYYSGKLLTTADFQAEQAYLGNKRCFVNGLLHGSGVICGLSVYTIDDITLMVESGVAVDGYGRDIVLENSAVRKLSAIEGFEEVKSDNVYLCLRYAEEAVQPVYAVGASDREGEYEMNRIREGGTLFLIDADSEKPAAEPKSEFLTHTKLYADADYAVSLVVPAVIPRGYRVRLGIDVEKLSDEDKAFSMAGTFQSTAFVGDGDEHEFRVDIPPFTLAFGETRHISRVLNVKTGDAAEATVLAKADQCKVVVDGKERHPQSNAMLRIAVTDEAADEVVEREIAKISLEARSAGGAAEAIKLAQIKFERNGSVCIIDDIREAGVKHYIRAASNDAKRNEFLAWFLEPSPYAAVREGGQADDAPEYFAPREPVYATGFCEIPIGMDGKKDKIFHSHEIIHGLGSGDVHVSVGFEYMAMDAKLEVQSKNTIYGDPSLFEEKKEVPVPHADLAVRVLCDRGSFFVAARLTKNTNYVVLLLRWVAVKFPVGEDRSIRTQLSGDASISPVQPTILVAPNESCFVDVRFKNMEACALAYELTEKNSGSITPDGIYTAPNKEGVNEVRITCADNIFISTFAYVVVKKKDKEGA